MNEDVILHIAIENFEKLTGLTTRWRHLGPKERIDGILEIHIENNTYDFETWIRREIKPAHINYLELYRRGAGAILIVERMSSKVREALREHNIFYLEANGNTFINMPGAYILIDNQKLLKQPKEKVNQAFSRTGLKIIFHFLQDETLVNEPYRVIAGRTGTGLANVNYVMTGLQEDRWMVELRNRVYQLQNKRELLNKWVTVYAEKLRPSLYIGTFAFIDESYFAQWKDIHLPYELSVWGGEAAGNILTGYLQPEILTIYTEESRAAMIVKYKLVPDNKGNVKLYKKFWDNKDHLETVPPLLAYADLVNTGDRRCMETAKKIYDEYLQDKF